MLPDKPAHFVSFPPLLYRDPLRNFKVARLPAPFIERYSHSRERRRLFCKMSVDAASFGTIAIIITG